MSAALGTVRLVGWNPWDELRRREHIVFRLHPIAALGGGAVYYRQGPDAAIVIDPALSRCQRKAALAHELIHDERGHQVAVVGMPATWKPCVVKDERQVDEEVARRLVPSVALRASCERRANLGDGTTIADIADEFDVPEYVARRALELLAL